MGTHLSNRDSRVVFRPKNTTCKKSQVVAMDVHKSAGTGRKIPNGSVPYFYKKHAKAKTHDCLGDEFVAPTDERVWMDTRIHIYGLDTLSRSSQKNSYKRANGGEEHRNRVSQQLKLRHEAFLNSGFCRLVHILCCIMCSTFNTMVQ